jgi:tetratricopeptide (TPR) repeat protein
LIRLAAMWTCCATLVACAPALREPPSLVELAGGRQVSSAQERGRILAEAERLLQEPDPVSMRTAAELFLRAAAGEPAEIGPLLGAVRAQVWLAGHVAEPAERKRAATGAVDAAQWCGRVDPAAPACRYWLAVALGVQARERRGTAMDALPRMVELLERAAEEEPGLDEAGPHRVLALLLLRAPGWPSGPGDPDRGLREARRAVELRPDHPPNQLCLGEALEVIGDREEAREAFRRAAVLASEGLRAGERDAAEWLDEAERALERM